MHQALGVQRVTPVTRPLGKLPDRHLLRFAVDDQMTAPQIHPFFFDPGLARGQRQQGVAYLVRGFQHRIPRHHGLTACAGGAGVGGFRRVRPNDAHRSHVDAEPFGRELSHDRHDTLAHIGSGALQSHRAVTKHFQDHPGMIGQTAAEPGAFEDRCHAEAPAKVRGRLAFDLVALVPLDHLGGPLQGCFHAAPFADNHARVHPCAGLDAVQQADFERVHAESARQVIHL